MKNADLTLSSSVLHHRTTTLTDMTNVRARLRMLAYVCVAGVVLTSCGNTDDGGTAAGGNDSDEENNESPLSEYLGDGFDMSANGAMVMVGAAELSDDDKQGMRQVEEKVAACMDERGFEYEPVPPGDEGTSEFDEAFSLDPADFAEKYGYGVTTMSPEESASAGDESDDENKNPNDEIRDGLSAAAQKEYDKALWGNQADMADSGEAVVSAVPEGEEETDPDKQGCHQRASDEVFGEQQAQMDPDEFSGLLDDIGTLRERIGNDPRIGEAEQGWSDCMAEEGHGEFSTPDEPAQQVMDRWSNMQDGGQSGGPADDQTVTAQPGSADVDPAELEKLQQYEIDVATADHGCQQGGYQEAYDEVSNELEQEFVDQHRDELERYRDAMAGAGNGEADGEQ